MMPLSARLLGFSGLLPFVVCTLALSLGILPFVPWLSISLCYGAVILSFLGGVHWAFAMILPELTIQQQRNRFIWSVIPSLLGWCSFALPAPYAGIILIIGFTGQFLQDLVIKKLAFLPAWYLSLRLQLSSVAILSLLINSLLAHQST